jgi:two-component system cell cycle sensor histidine kinase/response regulator CckA
MNPSDPVDRQRQSTDHRPQDSVSRPRRFLIPASWSELLVFFLACGLVIGFTSYHIARTYQNEETSWELRQASLAEDRAWAVSNYLHERQADAEVLAALPSVEALVSRAAGGGKGVPQHQPALQRGLTALVDQLISVYGYSGIYILGPEGQLYLRATDAADLSRAGVDLAHASVQGQRTQIELVGHSPQTSLLSFAVPVFIGNRVAQTHEDARKRAGVVVTQIPAASGLFPLLFASSVPSETGETVLMRFVGSEVEFISPLRNRDTGSPFLRRPLEQEGLAASAALRGDQAAGEFLDYRGERVIAATRRIPPTGWGLVRKIDHAEALTGFYQNARLEALAALLVILLVGGLLRGYRRRQVARGLKARVEQQQHILKVQEYAQEIVDSVPAGLLVLSSDLRVLSTNRTFLKLFHLRSEDVLGRRLDEVIQAESPPYRVSSISESELAPQSVLLDITLPGRQEKRPARITITSVAHGGTEGRLLVVVEDQSEGERLRAAAEASERRLRDLVQSVDAIVWEADAATFQFTFVSRRAELLLGYPIEDWLTLPHFWEQHIDPADRERTLAQCRKGTAAGRDYELEYRMVAADGRIVWLRDKVRVVSDLSGKPQQLCGVMVDITEEKRAEAELRRVNRALKTLSQCNQAMAQANSESKLLEEICRIIVEVGEYRFAWVGSAEQDKAKSIYVAARAGHEDGYLSQVKITWDESESGRGPTGTALRTGQVCIVRDVQTDPSFAPWRAQAVRRGYASLIGLPLIQEGKCCGVLTIYASEPNAFDAEEERLLTELAANVSYGLTSLRARLDRERVEEERARLSLAVEQAAEAIVVTDPQGNIVYVNPAFETVTGYRRSEVLDQNPRILKSGQHDAEFYRTLWETLTRGEAWTGRFVNRRKDNSLYEAEAVISPVRDGAGRVVNYVAVQRDVTRERQLEEQVRQSQRIEAVGRLAGGVAHDFNNLLTIITGYSDLLLDRLGPEHPERSHVNEIRKAADRAASLTRQLLAFSRRQVLAPQVLDLNSVVANLHNMLRRLIGEDVELVIAPGAQLGHVRVDPGQMEQVILNLVVNARDAMPQGGKITIETDNVVLAADYAGAHFRVKPGPYVALSVSDTGCGMPPVIQAHIFEPFFTTKEQGKGTGLGLAMVYGIVKQSGGYIWVYSEVSRGTTFKIHLPRVQVKVEPIEAPRRVEGRRGTETILLVEDEAAVRSLVRGVLEGGGYKVLVARNGEDALLVSEQHKGPIHLLVTDVVMPEMGGPQLAEHLRPYHRKMKVLYMSGYTDDAIVHHGMPGSSAAFLQKPFTPDALAHKVREVLDSPER